ncbi:MAG TPA: MFS transporter [Steroidobacteraceae bacterium]|nr:MFS transporter [Steroidobacteraceae bacterium]
MTQRQGVPGREAVDPSAGPHTAVTFAARGLFVLTLINLLNYLDRFVPSAVLPQMKASGIVTTDFQLGFLAPGFVVVYMLAAPAFGYLGDRRSRTRPIAIGVALWSLATMWSGLSRTYWELFASRAAVGIGEAAYATISPALLADYYPPVRRGRIFAIFYMAIPVGAALGYVVGGLVSQAWGWRAAFLVAGLPGLILAFLVLRVPDPPRGASEPPVGATIGGSAQQLTEPPGVLPALRRTLNLYLQLARQASYVLTVLGYAAYTFAVGGLAFWMPTFLERIRDVPATQATTGFGAIVVVTGFVGTFAGGWLGDYCLRYTRQAYLWISGIATLLAVPFAIAALTSPSPAVFYPALVIAELLLFMSTGPVNSVIVSLVRPAHRASAVALSVLAIHLLGDVISPPLIGSVSDHTSLGEGVLLVPVAVVLSGLFWVAAALRCRREALAA